MTAAAMHAQATADAPSGAPRWDVEGRDWPNRDASRFVRAGGLRWHVQVMGSGPVLLLAHGTGAATHSWRALAPLLAAHFTVVAPDLPGHGFTERPPSSQMSLPGMAHALGALIKVLGVEASLVAGHSAGAAILARCHLDGSMRAAKLISLNGALLPLVGLPGHIFAPIARVLAMVPGVPWFFARHGADKRTVERLLRDTGSRVDPEAVEFYGRLVRCPGHVAAALGMMAHWDLAALERSLKRLDLPVVLMAGANDRTVPAEDARRAAEILPQARVVELPGLGHLAHEEAPELVARLIAAEAL
jgi:magnesium chelatase accessory protein